MKDSVTGSRPLASITADTCADGTYCRRLSMTQTRKGVGCPTNPRAEGVSRVTRASSRRLASHLNRLRTKAV